MFSSIIWKKFDFEYISYCSNNIKVTWWRDHHLLDSSLVSVASVSPHSVEAVLTLPSLAREDLHSILTCQASNSNATVPVSTSVKLDMTCELKMMMMIMMIMMVIS